MSFCKEAEKTPELKMTGSQLADFYADLCANYPLITIEDPFDQAWAVEFPPSPTDTHPSVPRGRIPKLLAEDDWAAWTGFTAKVGGPTQVAAWRNGGRLKAMKLYCTVCRAQRWCATMITWLRSETI